MEKNKIGNLFKGDKVIWMVFFLLCMISIVEVYSASSSLSYKGGNYWSPILKHCGLLFLGVMAMLVIVNIPCKYFKFATPFLIGISLFMLAMALFGPKINDGGRWVSILGIQFQPSEIAKGTLVLSVAQILSAMQTEKGADRQAFKYIMIISCVLILPIMVENLSTAMLIALTVLIMMFLGRVPGYQLGRLLGIVAITIVLIVSAIMLVGDDKQAALDEKQNLTEQMAGQPKEKPGVIKRVFHRFDTWKARIMKFSDHTYVPPEKYDITDKDAQVGHANIAIASSNIVGKGPGNSTERDFLSQAFSDFIYAIIIEEMGIEGAAFVALLYIILLFRAGIIANRCENNFPAFLAMGLAVLLVSQALFNMLVAVGLAPVTGQPLPLISKGGTSSIINCLYIGALLSISHTAKRKTELASSSKTSGANRADNDEN